jgi:hypothetical protein
MVKTLAQVNEALTREYSKDNFPAPIKAMDGFDYIEWHESNRLANEIFGTLGWSSAVLSCEYVECEVPVRNRDTNEYELRPFKGFKSIVRVEVQVWDEEHGILVKNYHDGIGFGNIIGQGNKNPMDNASKSAKSDGLSTAFKHYGDALGLFLYKKAVQSSGGSYGEASTGSASYGSSSQDVGPRPSAGQCKGLYAIGLNDEQIASVPFKVWKAMLDDFWNKDQSKKLTANQVLEKYELQGTPQPTQKRSYPFQKAS